MSNSESIQERTKPIGAKLAQPEALRCSTSKFDFHHPFPTPLFTRSSVLLPEADAVSANWVNSYARARNASKGERERTDKRLTVRERKAINLRSMPAGRSPRAGGESFAGQTAQHKSVVALSPFSAYTRGNDHILITCFG